MKSKHSGMEDMVELVEAELVLETFLEKQDGILPRHEHKSGLRQAETLLNDTIGHCRDSVVLEAHLLLAKLHYTCAAYKEALNDIENSGMEHANTPFRTLRALRLVAEVYAVKGFCMEALEINEKGYDKMKALFCYEKAAELAILYIGEIEKNIVAGSGKGSALTPTTGLSRSEKLGDILECCLERVAALRVRCSSMERNSNVEGIEWYRRIITCLGDKSTGERLQQKMSRQFAELLLRAVPADGRSGATSLAVSMKSQNLSFYMGSHKGYFSPMSRMEEVILLLLISEVLSTREVVLNRSSDLSTSRNRSIKNAKSVYNLLTLVFSSLRQYHLLSTIYERSMKFVNQDQYLWQQFALSLVCRGRYLRAVRVLEQCIAAGHQDKHQTSNEVEAESSDSVMHHMQAAILYMEHLGQNDSAVNHAMTAVELSSVGALNYLKGRAQLLCAIAHGRMNVLPMFTLLIKICHFKYRYDNRRRALCEPCFNGRRRLLAKALMMFENCVNTDPHDYLAHYYCALYHAIVCDLEAARERCARSLELNPEQPSAILLLALIFTAENDLKGALELVVNALKDFPSHYGLLVLQLHIETQFGRVEESLDTCSHLLEFWHRRDCWVEDERTHLTLGATDGQSVLRENSSIKAGTPSVGRELSSSTPLFANPLGIGISTPILNPTIGSTQSGLEMSVSAVDSGVSASEAGCQSVSSESCGGSAGSAAAWTRFRAQANMWMALAELFLAEGRLSDVAPCVEQAVSLFPHAHQALYLKGRLYIARAEETTDPAIAVKLRAEANVGIKIFFSERCQKLLCLTYFGHHYSQHWHYFLHILQAYSISLNYILLKGTLSWQNKCSTMNLMISMEENYGTHPVIINMAVIKWRIHVLELVRVDPLNCQWWQELGCCLMQRGNAVQAMECFTAASQLDRSTPLLPFVSIPLVFPSSV
ncbi:tetratricopeptide repeat protein [Dictyocaulus viviparus]|uniref:Tetratricopeptide repeat protein n=1 Tax=Dictyocaulus viviparus TaxID=29172 RepID=A0A0D8YAS1_DICVI|nr:tetratricopeptide repeat protein [Dictyocaulus viviparus]